MPRPRNPFPAPRRHKGSAVVDLYIDGRRRTVTLGPWGSPEAEREYARLVGERKVSAGPTGRPDVTRTHEVVEYRMVARFLRERYGHTPAAEFGPLALKALRRAFIDAEWCRSLVNQRTNRARRVFKWAAGEELIPFDVYHRLTTVAGLQKGRSGVREADPVTPVPEADALAVLPYLRPEVAAMVRVQLLTGMRPGEVCRIRPADIDTGGPVWVYRPVGHKTEWKGKNRAVAIGPKAQAILAGFTPPDPSGYYFSPRRAVERLHAERTAARKTPRYPSHMARNEAKRTAAPRRAPAERYTPTSYGHAIGRACERAGVPHWHPNQLRHAFATEVRRGFGLEAAQVLLGHERADVTQVYAEKNHALAVRVAAEVG